MNKPIERKKLENVLDDYVASGAGPHEPLDEWIQNYPEYEQELIEFAASWSLMESLPPAPNAKEVDVDTLVLRGMSIVQNLLHAQALEPATRTVPPFASLIGEGRICGLKPRQLAQEVELGDSVLRKLDRRLILFTSIPKKLIESLAEVIQSETARVAAYLQQSPTLATATEHRSEHTPVLTDQEDFFDAVRADPTIKREHAVRWLELEQSKGRT